MLLTQHLRGGRRRSAFSGGRACAFTAVVLLLLSVILLYSRLLRSEHHHSSPLSLSSEPDSVSDSLLDDPPDNPVLLPRDPDLIDELDDPDPDPEAEQDEEDEEDEVPVGNGVNVVPKYKFDHVSGVIRRPFDKRSIDQWEDYDNSFNEETLAKGTVFGSDDVAVDEVVRRKLVGVRGVEDALLLKGSGLREGWGPWFEAKSDFLRRDRMFRSNLEGLNPLNNPMLQDPDGVGVTGLTKGDKLIQKGFLHEFKKVPFLVKKSLRVDEGSTTSRVGVKNGETTSMKKPLVVRNTAHELQLKSEQEFKTLDDSVVGLITKRNGGVSVKDGDVTSTKNPVLMKDSSHELRSKSIPKSREEAMKMRDEDVNVESKQFDGEIKTVERRFLIENASDLSIPRKNADANGTFGKDISANISSSNMIQSSGSENVKPSTRIKQGSSGEVHANGKRWGYFPGLHPRLSFSNFMDSFFREGNCFRRLFMVWNSPPWMFTVRQQRGLESLLLHHRNACLVVFSETIELNFFEGFVMDGFKVAVAMPNLDELLKDTPTHEFASVWYEWRKTLYYSTHYSELVRLAALYKYGGIYLDSDIIVLRPLSSFSNTVGLEDLQAGNSLNGAVMSFRKHSPFIMECLKEFYSTYDDAHLRWNGADLLTRVAKNYTRNMNTTDHKMELKLQHSSVFFPISRDNIIRYFSAPETETERAEQNELFQKILNESFTFHFWNSLTSALVPEPESLVARIINQHCIRCTDVL